MAIRRAKRQSNFTMISNVGLRDKNLSLKAKGLLSYMLSLPDDWVFYESELIRHSKDGRDAHRSALRELQDNGYLTKTQAKSKNGKFSEVDWELTDEPLTEKPSTEKPSADKPSTENPPLLNTNHTKDLSKQNTNNTNDHSDKPNESELSERFEELWKQYPNKKGKPKAFTAYKSAIKAGTTDDEILKGIESYKREIEVKRTDKQYIAHGSTWFSQNRWLDEYDLVGGGTEWDRNAPVDEELGF